MRVISLHRIDRFRNLYEQIWRTDSRNSIPCFPMRISCMITIEIGIIIDMHAVGFWIKHNQNRINIREFHLLVKVDDVKWWFCLDWVMLFCRIEFSEIFFFRCLNKLDGQDLMSIVHWMAINGWSHRFNRFGHRIIWIIKIKLLFKTNDVLSKCTTILLSGFTYPSLSLVQLCWCDQCGTRLHPTRCQSMSRRPFPECLRQFSRVWS